MRIRFRFAALAFGCFLALSVAWVGAAPPAGSTAQQVSAARGGVVVSPSGRLVLTIPAGALAADTTVFVAETAPGEDLFVGPTFVLQPDGLQFRQPAGLTIRYAPADLPAGYEPDDVAITEVNPEGKGTAAAAPPGGDILATGGWQYLDSDVDADAGTVSGEISHFSRYSLRAIAGYRLGTGMTTLKGPFDYGIKYADETGAGAAKANWGKVGEVFEDVAVTFGSEGLAMAHVEIAKWFRVKPGKTGQRSSDQVYITGGVEHNALFVGGTNQYIITLGFVLADAAAQPIGTPEITSILPPKGGRFTSQGVLNQVYFHDPMMPNLTQFPAGPPYEVEHLKVTFKNCRLVAGRIYGLTTSVTTSVAGRAAQPHVDPTGGGVRFYGPFPGKCMIDLPYVDE